MRDAKAPFDWVGGREGKFERGEGLSRRRGDRRGKNREEEGGTLAEAQRSQRVDPEEFEAAVRMKLKDLEEAGEGDPLSEHLELVSSPEEHDRHLSDVQTERKPFRLHTHSAGANEQPHRAKMFTG